MKIIKNHEFLTTLNATGRSVPVKTPIAFLIANEIKDFEHVSHGTAVEDLHGLCWKTGLAPNPAIKTYLMIQRLSNELILWAADHLWMCESPGNQTPNHFLLSSLFRFPRCAPQVFARESAFDVVEIA